MTHTEKFAELISLIEFRLIKDGGAYALEDIQGVNLANIEADRFASASEIVDRIGVYIDDYILHDDEEDGGNGWFESLEELLEKKPNHPCAAIADTVVHHLDEVDLDKVCSLTAW